MCAGQNPEAQPRELPQLPQTFNLAKPGSCATGTPARRLRRAESVNLSKGLTVQ
jgi:hypothetical protein